MTDNTRLRIAMQKSGRLSDDSRELLARCAAIQNQAASTTLGDFDALAELKAKMQKGE